MLEILILGAFFCYGVFTIQRNGFMLDFMPKFWKKFPKGLHEPLFSCVICVSSIWGGLFLFAYNYIQKNIATDNQLLYMIPFYLLAFVGFTALIDRAVKAFEYTYKYTQIKPLSNYSYLENNDIRDSMIECIINDVVSKGILLLEVGGITEKYKDLPKYASYDKSNGCDVIGTYIGEDYFLLIKGLAFEGNFDYLMGLIANSQGFIIEGSLAGDSGKQLNWILDKYPSVKRIPYMTDNCIDSPTHCGSDISNRIVLIKK